MSLKARVRWLEAKVGIKGCATCREWPDTFIPPFVHESPDGTRRYLGPYTPLPWEEHDWRCPQCGRTPRTPIRVTVIGHGEEYDEEACEAELQAAANGNYSPEP